MLTSRPLVSYIVPTYWSNLSYVDQCLESIKQQTYTDIEIILSVDAHTALARWTLNSLAKYCGSVEQVKVVVNHEWPGAALTRNHAIIQAQGELIALLDDDDTILPEKTALQVNYFQANPDTQLVGSWFMRVNAQGSLLHHKRLYTNGNDIKKNFLTTFPFLPSTCMLDRELFTKIGFFDTAYTASEDGDFLYRAILACRWEQLANLPFYLTSYRVHDESISHRKRRKQRREAFHLVYQYAKIVYGSYSPQLVSALWVLGLKTLFSHPTIKPYALRVYDMVQNKLSR